MPKAASVDHSNMNKSIRFSGISPRSDRLHYISADDITVLLDRLPPELWDRLRGVHFNDRGFGVRRLGYVNRGHRQIALCALPPRISVTRFLRRPTSPSHFGARRGVQWPHLAIRRFMLYEVFLHELGHLQVIDDSAKSPRHRFAREKLAQDFADRWRRRLWAEPFDHPDPVHNAPLREVDT